MGTQDRTLEETPLIGRMVGNYRVDKQLGSGGMGAVYLLRHAELPDTFLALKVLQPGMQAVTVERFKQEARAAAAVGSHRVAKMHDTGSFADGQPYIVMEYIDGRSLSDELAEVGPLAVESALKIAVRVADTLVAAHSKQIVHRDIKPTNIMICKEGVRTTVKILDFGVASAAGANKLVQTQERAVIGTPGYMAPEATLGGSTDGRADVFSLAVVLYEMLTGQVPFPFPRDMAKYTDAVMQMLSRPAPEIATIRSKQLDHVPAFVEATIGRALAKDPAQRLTMTQFHAELLLCLQKLEGGNVPKPLSTMLSTAVPFDEKSTNAPTLRPSETISEFINRIGTPQPSAPTLPGKRTDGNRNRWIVPLAAAVVAAAIAVALVVAILWGRNAAAPVERLPEIVTPSPAPSAPAPSAPAPQEPGRLRVVTTPTGAVVSVDGREVGPSPVVISGKPGSRVRLHVVLDGYDDYDDAATFVIGDGDANVRLRRKPSLTKRRSKHVEAPVNPFEAAP